MTEENNDTAQPVLTREQEIDLIRQRRYLRHHLNGAIVALMYLNGIPHEQDDEVYIEAIEQLRTYIRQLERREL